MKKVIGSDELKIKIKEALELLCDTISKTLGPSGNNILLDTKDLAPFITNDGVTIASSISSSDEATKALLEIIKEASMKTNEMVGDGTTTTLVLLKAIYDLGLKEIENGTSLYNLKKIWHEELKKILDEIERKSRKPTTNDLYQIAYSACNDEVLSKVSVETILKVKTKNAIKILESKTKETYFDYVNGYVLNSFLSHEYFLNGDDKIAITHPYVLIYKGFLNSLEEISSMINPLLKDKESIILMTEGYSKELKETCLSLYYEKKVYIYLLELPTYDSMLFELYKDLESLLNFNNDISRLKEVVFTREETILFSNQDTNKRKEELENEILMCHSNYQKEDLQRRLSMLETGLCTIYVGGYTEVEKKEKIMRLEDALCSLEVSFYGVNIGSGVTLYQIKKENKNLLLSEILDIPLKQIILNKGISNLELEKHLKQNEIYNFTIEKWEDMNLTDVLDATKVCTISLQNAFSIALMLLNLSFLVINVDEKNERDEF